MLQWRSHPPDARDPGVLAELEERAAALHVVAVREREALGLGVLDHGAELEDVELPPARSVAALAEEDGAGRVEADEQRARRRAAG